MCRSPPGSSRPGATAEGPRCCYKLERTLAPTVVTKDKKRYAIYSQFDKNKGRYEEAH